MMKKIKVKIGWSGKNYSGVIDDVQGIVVATHKTFEGIKKEMESALLFHILGLIDDCEDLPEYLKNRSYQLEYELQTSAILKQLDGIITRSALAKASKINERQLGHYIQGKKEARNSTRLKLIKGIQIIKEELLEVV